MIVIVSGLEIYYEGDEVSHIKPCPSTTYDGWTVWGNYSNIVRDIVDCGGVTNIELILEYDVTYMNELLYAEDKT